MDSAPNCFIVTPCSATGFQFAIRDAANTHFISKHKTAKSAAKEARRLSSQTHIVYGFFDYSKSESGLWTPEGKIDENGKQHKYCLLHTRAPCPRCHEQKRAKS